MTGTVRLALLGAGGIGHAYAQALGLVDEVELVAVADVRPEAAEPLARTSGVPAVADPLELADPDQVDLVLVCTPPATHDALAVAFLEAGVAVMCEKPLARSRAAGHRIVAAAASTGTLLTMASKFRFVSDVREAHEIVASGALGDVVSAEVTFSAPVDMRGRWNSDPEVSGGGVLIDNGSHAVDIVRYVLGPVASVLATLDTSTDGLGVEDSAHAYVRTVDDRLASISLSWCADPVSDRYLAVLGTEGSLEVGWHGSRIRRRASVGDAAFGTGYDKHAALAGNVRNVARAVRGQEDLLVTPLDALASVAVVEAAYESATSGTWTRVSVRSQERLTG